MPQYLNEVVTCQDSKFLGLNKAPLYAGEVDKVCRIEVGVGSPGTRPDSTVQSPFADVQIYLESDRRVGLRLTRRDLQALQHALEETNPLLDEIYDNL